MAPQIVEYVVALTLFAILFYKVYSTPACQCAGGNSTATADALFAASSSGDSTVLVAAIADLQQQIDAVKTGSSGAPPGPPGPRGPPGTCPLPR